MIGHFGSLCNATMHWSIAFSGQVHLGAYLIYLFALICGPELYKQDAKRQ